MMRKLLGLLAICMALGSTAAAQGFYDVDSINIIEIVFVESNWDQILKDLYAAGNEERLAGTAFINGVEFDSVGVRYKGNSSYNPTQVKNPLNIKLDYVHDDQLYEGYGTLKLSNGFKDPSLMREVLSYEVARKYMPAGLANYANVHINGEYIGLYTSVQDMDKFFMRTHFQGDENACFKGELTGPPGPVTVWGYYGPDWADYYWYYELESDSGWADLIEFLDTLNNNTNAIEDVLDVDRHLWMLAFDNLLVNLDAPINFAHNYYLYRDGSGRFNPIVWDLNESFGAFDVLLPDGVPLDLQALRELDPFLHSTHPGYPIVNKILPDPTYRKMYIAHMKTMIQENFANSWYETRALGIQSIITADVQADPNKLYSYSAFLDNVDISASGVVGITELMDDRATFVMSLPDFLATQPSFAGVAHTPSDPPPGSTVWFTAEVSNANAVMLAYRHGSVSSFSKTAMFDDGSHNDGAAGDGLFGMSVLAGSSDIQYYVYAENIDAAMFSPERAEYEFYTVPVTADVAINEFMADNETTIADQDDEYDDWIELYNTTASTISLAGYYLSDDAGDPIQWMFPDTTIAANGYLLIWTDNDEEQEGLHANFKLSANGESILLVDPSEAVIDEIAFGEQGADTSYGRLPDGSDNWVSFDTPTPGVTNGSAGCCIPPTVGDLDQSGGELGFNYDGSDLSLMINGLFINPTTGWDGVCWDEADIDFSGGRPVTTTMAIDGADLSLLIDALFIAPLHYLKNCDGSDNW
ncbi:MAG: hypothetical protein DRP45_08075 [Candidatus Zixiibacteriota bacterium]|nr:MAG: hypothetical protein DRP45_08075 [candidate division Zixibacteria bacterium]